MVRDQTGEHRVRITRQQFAQRDVPGRGKYKDSQICEPGETTRMCVRTLSNVSAPPPEKTE